MRIPNYQLNQLNYKPKNVIYKKPDVSNAVVILKKVKFNFII